MDNIKIDIYDNEFMSFFASGMYGYSCRMNEPFTLYRPSICKDGNQWCVLYGDNLQDGVAGFGDSPEEAVKSFNKAWAEPLKKEAKNG